MPRPPEGHISGWIAIGEVLGVHPETARQMAAEREDPMPIARLFGRVIAKSDELEAWATRRRGPRCPTCGCRQRAGRGRQNAANPDIPTS